MENRSKELAEWFGVQELSTLHAWRIPEGENAYKCLDCGFYRGAGGKYCRAKTPDYRTDFFALLKGLRLKQIGSNVQTGDTQWALNEGATATLVDANHNLIVEVEADTLQEAAYLAAIEAMDAEQRLTLTPN